MKIKEIISFLDDRFHPEYQEDYDNSGFLVGDGEAECTGVLVALDLTIDVLREAERIGMNLIVTHHPFIFGGLKRITDKSEVGRMVMDMVRHGVATYAAHTNLDNLPDGVNGILCKKLGLVGCTILKPITQGVNLGAGMVGELEKETSAEEFLRMVKERFSLPWIRLSGNRERVKKVAVCGGSGAFLISDAINSGADVYLTADLKYHDFQRTEGRMLLADIGHYESEQFAKEIIYNAILEKFCNFACRISECQQSVVHYI